MNQVGNAREPLATNMLSEVGEGQERDRYLFDMKRHVPESILKYLVWAGKNLEHSTVKLAWNYSVFRADQETFNQELLTNLSKLAEETANLTNWKEIINQFGHCVTWATAQLDKRATDIEMGFNELREAMLKLETMIIKEDKEMGEMKDEAGLLGIRVTSLENFINRQSVDSDNVIGLQKHIEREIIGCQKSVEDQVAQSTKLFNLTIGRANSKIDELSKELLAIKEKQTSRGKAEPENISQRPEGLSIEDLFEQLHQQERRLEKLETRISVDPKTGNTSEFKLINKQIIKEVDKVVRKFLNGNEGSESAQNQGYQDKKSKSSNRCFNCNEEGHIARNCKNHETPMECHDPEKKASEGNALVQKYTNIVMPWGKGSEKRTCFGCKQPGHLQKDCRRFGLAGGKSEEAGVIAKEAVRRSEYPKPGESQGVPGRVPKTQRRKECFKCGQRGHKARACRNSKMEEGTRSRGSGGTGGEIVHKSCFGCGERGHQVRDCQESGPRKKERTSEECFGCGKLGHMVRDCHETRGGRDREARQQGGNCFRKRKGWERGDRGAGRWRIAHQPPWGSGSGHNRPSNWPTEAQWGIPLSLPTTKGICCETAGSGRPWQQWAPGFGMW
jgi:hypothetical protein